MIRKILALMFTFIGLLFIGTGLGQSQDDADRQKQALLGGTTTIANTSQNAFGQASPGLERPEELFFFVGNSFFNQNWVTAPSSTTARDGLGPLYNSRSCAGCHFKDGRGRPPEYDGETPTGLLIRLSIPERNLVGGYLPDPTYGGQFQDNAVEGVLPEGTLRVEYTEIAGTFADGTAYSLRQPTYHLENLNYGELDAEVMMSPRVAPQMIGMGLLEAIDEDTILALADPNDINNDGISGRPNYVWDVVNNQMSLGRFGWKANEPTVQQQVAGAFNGDVGITTGVFPQDHCTPAQPECLNAPNGGQGEITDDDLGKVVIYSSSLAVPAQRDYDNPQVIRGGEIFAEADCTACHIPTLETGIHRTLPVFSQQTIHPYTDLLLHDMGAGLADNRLDYQANGQEWRTPPLWGIGLFETVNGHTYYLHDGRARNLTEAIIWHDGEAQASRDYFLELSANERAALIAFLESL